MDSEELIGVYENSCVKPPETVKNDQGKAPIGLVDPDFIKEVAEILSFGVKKYGPYNWAIGTDWDRAYSAAQRHMMDWWQGKELDSETDKSHLAHAACNLMFLMYYQRHNKGKDTRHKTEKSL